MAFTPIAGQLNYALPDPIGIDQLKRRNALADRDQALQEQNAQTSQNMLALQQQGMQRNFLAQDQASKQQAISQIGGLAQQALASGNPRAFAAQAVSDPTYQSIFQAAGIDPSQIKVDSPEFDQHLQMLAGFGPQQKPIEMNAGATLLDPNTHKAIFTAPAAPAKESGFSLSPGETRYDARGKVIASAAPKVDPTPNMLTPEGMDLAAQEYLNSGKLPPGLGKASAGINARIVSRAAEMAKANGNDAQAATLNRAAFKSAQVGLTALTKQRTLVGAFERTALKNLEIAVAESEKVDRTGSPAINRWLLSGKKNLTGDVEVGRFNAALTSALNEYAKVLSGATGAAGISDAARKEAEDLLSTANTPEQVRGIMDIMKREMANREAGFAEQEAQLKETMSGKPPVAVAPAEQGAPVAPGSAAAPNSSQPRQVRSIQEAQALPPGTAFITPDGRRMVRR
jgi:hypothetical protein